MNTLPSLVAAIVLVALSALYAFRAVKATRFGIADRTGAIAESAGLLTLFTVLHFATGWAGVPLSLWVVAVIAASVGVAALVVRAAGLPWLRSRRRLWMRVTRLSLAGIACGGVLILGSLAFSG